MRPRRRTQSFASRVRTCALFFFLGLTVTVLLSWMFALLGGVDRAQYMTLWSRTSPQPLPHATEVKWPSKPPPDWPEPAYVQWAEGRGIRFEAGTAKAHADGSRVDYQMSVLRTGWPFHALKWQVITKVDSNTGARIEYSTRWIDVPSGIYPEWLVYGYLPALRRLPIEPTWPGFFLNVLLYGGGLWMLLRARRALRSYLRSRRGQCSICGYDLRGVDHNACPECGAIVAEPLA